jgi:TonB family protein
MIAYVLLLAAATVADKPAPVKIDAPAPLPRPYYKTCPDGSRVSANAQCPRTNGDRSRPPKPRNNPGLWVGTNDYPSLALRDEVEGTTGFRLTVGPDGLVKTCDVFVPSGSALLDAATCRNVTRRARFEPALDPDGNPTVGTYANRVSWRIPSGPSFARQIGFEPSGPQPTFGTYIEVEEVDYPLEALEKGMRGPANVVLSISDKGVVTECQVELSTGHALLDSRTCEIARTWKFLPARDPSGTPIGGKTIHMFSWVLPYAWREYQRTGLYPAKPPSQ